MLTSKKRAAKRGCWTEGIASRAYQYRRAKTNFKWIHQLKSGPCKSTIERWMVSYTLLLLIIHPDSNLFPITLSGKGLCERPAAARMSVPLSRLQPLPHSPRPCTSYRQHSRLEMALVLCITGTRCRGCHRERSQGGKSGLSGVLATSQGQWRMERSGNCPGKGRWQFCMMILE